LIIPSEKSIIIRKRNGDPYPATTLRQIVLSLQQFLELQGRHVKFLSGVKFRAIRDTLDALMKERAQAGVGMHVAKRLIGSGYRLRWRGVGRGMDVLGEGGERGRGRGSFGGEFCTSYCNRWGFCDVAVLHRHRRWGRAVVPFPVKFGRKNLSGIHRVIFGQLIYFWKKEEQAHFIFDSILFFHFICT